MVLGVSWINTYVLVVCRFLILESIFLHRSVYLYPLVATWLDIRKDSMQQIADLYDSPREGTRGNTAVDRNAANTQELLQ